MKLRVLFIGFTLIILITNSYQVKAQSSISFGFGMPEYINVGYKWHKEQSGYGVAIGTLPSSDNFLISARAGYLYHFMGRRKHSEIKPWYVNPGFAYNAIKSNAVTDHYLIADLRVGREFSINPSWGVLAEVGVFYIFWKETALNSFSFAFDYKNQINPSINIGMYYRFPKPCNCPKIKKKP